MQSIYHLEHGVVVFISRHDLQANLYECGLILLLLLLFIIISVETKFKQHHRSPFYLHRDHSHHQGHLNHSYLDPN
jgi:hypothetical protein